MPAVTGEDRLSYNGAVFTGHESGLKIKVTQRPEYDGSGRTVKYSEYVIETDGYVLPQEAGLTTDSDLEALRVLLSAPGGVLVFANQGMGTLSVNGGTVRDVNWGPKPRILRWQPIGHKYAAKVSWVVTTCIPECDGARYDGILSLNYAISRSVDQGWTTRVIRGELEIAQTWAPGRSRRVKDTADSFLEQVFPQAVPGFVRSHSSDLDPSRNVLHFTITDHQIRHPYPDGCTHAALRQEIHSDPMKGFLRWNVVLSGSVTIAPDKSPAHAQAVINQLIESRLKDRKAVLEQIEQQVGKGQGYTIIPVSFRISEDDTFEKGTTSFTAAFIVAGTSLANVLKATRMWKPIHDTGFARWQSSLSGSMFNPRGSAGLLPEDGETIVDLCLRKEPREIRTDRDRDEGFRDTPLKKTGTRVARLDPENTWLTYENVLRVEETNNVVRHKVLPIKDVPAVPAKFDPVGGGGGAGRGAGDIFASIPQEPITPTPRLKGATDVVQRRGTPTYSVLMLGRATRVGFPIPIPRLVKVGGVEVERTGGDSQCGPQGAVGGVPIYLAQWWSRYILPEAMRGRIPDLENPVLDTPGGQK